MAETKNEKGRKKKHLYGVQCHGTNPTCMHGMYSLNSNGRKKYKIKKYLQPRPSSVSAARGMGRTHRSLNLKRTGFRAQGLGFEMNPDIYKGGEQLIPIFGPATIFLTYLRAFEFFSPYQGQQSSLVSTTNFALLLVAIAEKQLQYVQTSRLMSGVIFS